MPISSGHDEVGALGANQVEELGRDRAASALPDLVRHDDFVTHEIAADVGKTFLGLRFRLVLADLHDQSFLGLLQ